MKKCSEIGHSAAFIRKRPLIKKYYQTPYFCGLYSRAASNRERLLMARLRYFIALDTKNKENYGNLGKRGKEEGEEKKDF